MKFSAGTFKGLLRDLERPAEISKAGLVYVLRSQFEAIPGTPMESKEERKDQEDS